MISAELLEKLHPALKEDPFEISVFAILKTLFDAENFSTVPPDSWMDVIDALCKQSRYEEKANIFLSTEWKKKSKSNRGETFKELFVFMKEQINKIIMGKNSSFYCYNCMIKSSEDNGLFEWIGPREYNYKDDDKTCDNFDGFNNMERTNIKGVDFLNHTTLDIVVEKNTGSLFTIEFNKSLLDLIPAGSAIKVSEDVLGGLLGAWYKHVINMTMPPASPTSKLFIYSVEAAQWKADLVSLPESDFIYEKGKLRHDAGAVSKEMRLIASDVIKETSIENREKKILAWAKKQGIEILDYVTLKNRYFPEVDHDDLFMMAMHDKLYDSALEKVGKDAKGKRFTLSVVS